MFYLDNFRSRINTNRIIRKCFNFEGRGNRISLTPEDVKEAAKNSIGIDSTSEVIQIKHLIMQIELIIEQLEEIDKKIEFLAASFTSSGVKAIRFPLPSKLKHFLIVLISALAMLDALPNDFSKLI